MGTDAGTADRDAQVRTLFAALARAILLLAGVAALLWFLARIQQVVLLLMVVGVLAIAVNAPVTALERRGWSRGAGLAVVSLALLALGAALAWILVPRLVREVPGLVSQVEGMARQVAQEAGEWFGLEEEAARQVDRLVAWGESAVQEAWRFAGSLFAGVVMAIVTVALVVYVVARPRPLLAGALRATPPHLRRPVAEALARGSRMVVGWVTANAIVGGLKAVSAFLFLTFMGVPGALLWSVLAFFSALVPQIGFYLMSIPPVMMAFAVDPMTAVWVGLFFWSLSTFLGNFVAPHIQGERMDLHPAYLLAATVAFGYAFGVLGVLIAAPVAGFFKAFLDAFYLERQPEDPLVEARVDAILARDPKAVG